MTINGKTLLKKTFKKSENNLLIIILILNFKMYTVIKLQNIINYFKYGIYNLTL